jgi:hypothetical protein
MMGHGMSVLLITSAVGYWTLTSAGREKGRVKTLGQYLGLLIIVLSLAAGACKAYYTVKACQMGGGMYSKACPFGSKKMGGVATCPAGHPGCTMACSPGDKPAQ